MSRHILILPDSFKGTLSSSEAGEAIRLGIRDELPLARLDVFPMADGGEGSSGIIAATVGAERHDLKVFGPEGELVDGFYYLTSDRVAYIELAAASGFALVKNRNVSARIATTFGTGQLILSAVEKGAQKIFLFVGGSATTDGGVGIAKALGFRFFDAKGVELSSCLAPRSHDHQGETLQGGSFQGERLIEIARIQPPTKSAAQGTEFVVVADVENPLHGPRGAAATYGPQKGATPEDVAYLDAGLKNLAAVVQRDLGLELENLAGTGAAGGSCYGMMCFLGAKRLRGPSFFLDIIAFDERLKSVDLVVTGEGRCDRQSTEGKLLAEIYRRSEARKVQVLSLCGEVNLSDEDMLKLPRLIALGLGQSDGLSNSFQALRRLSRQVAKFL